MGINKIDPKIHIMYCKLWNLYSSLNLQSKVRKSEVIVKVVNLYHVLDNQNKFGQVFQGAWKFTNLNYPRFIKRGRV